MADGTIQGRTKIAFREITCQRRKLTDRLATTTSNRNDSAQLVEAALQLPEMYLPLSMIVRAQARVWIRYVSSMYFDD